MNEREGGFGPEEETIKEEPTAEDVVNACVELFGEEVKEDFAGLDFDETWNYAYTLLETSGQDPDEFFLNKGLQE